MFQIIAVVIVLFITLLYQLVIGVYDTTSYTLGGAPPQKWYAAIDVNDRPIISPLEYQLVCKTFERNKPVSGYSVVEAYTDGVMQQPLMVPPGCMHHGVVHRWKGNMVALVRFTQGTCVYGRVAMQSRAQLDLLLRHCIPGYVPVDLRRSIREDLRRQCTTLRWDNPDEIIEYSRVVTFDLSKTVRLPRHVYLAPKLGGEMCYVYYNTDGYPFHIRDTYVTTIQRARSRDHSNSLWVAELVGDNYWVVDLLLDRGRYVADDEFETRWSLVPADDNMPTGFRRQSYTRTGWEDRRNNTLGWHSGLQAVDAQIAELNADGISTDGIIIQPPRTPYYTLQVQKWKPPHEQTVDALLDGKSGWLHNRGQLVRHNAKAYSLQEPLSIGECLVQDGVLKPTGRMRPDKYRPNSEAALRQPEFLSRRDVLEGRTGHLMKIYNRSSQDWTIWPTVRKRSTLLDIGAGKGRSQDWWKRLGLRVYAVEPNAENYKVLVQRGRPYRSAQIGGEDTALRELVPEGCVDTVLMSFSISFFFQSPVVMGKLLDNICWALRDGGTLIGVGLDGDCVLKALGENNDDIDSEAFRIHSITHSSKPSTYGCKILINMKHEGSLVKDQEEYLVFWNEWVRVLDERGIKLVRSEFLQGHWSLARWPLWFTRSSRWWVFKRSV